jgi:5'-deoxy-5'-methylthioadenosine phosphorylase
MSEADMNKQQAEIAVIGGTGLYQLQGLEQQARYSLNTRWGEPSSEVVISQLQGEGGPRNIAFLARHGETHNIPPHKINYRANLWALKELGVKKILAVGAVGGITDNMSPETLLVPDQIIDYTYGREHTYFADDLQQVTHIDFTEPYSRDLRATLLQVAQTMNIACETGGVYAAAQGPRLETAAEIEKYRRDGAHVVGMTGMPEAALAREIELDYACLGLVVNWAAGCAGTRVIDHAEMQQIVDKGMVTLQHLLLAALKQL